MAERALGRAAAHHRLRGRRPGHRGARDGAPARPARRPSPWLARAVIAAEDSRYFEHPGYDLDSALQSFDGNQREGRALGGASTLTQQLAKLVYTGDDRTPARKLRELLYAVEMERTLGKARILDLYLAMAPWGDGVCGAHQAALRHIGKPAHALDASEAARLAILLRNPQAPEDPARVDAVLRSLKQRPQAAAAVRERPGSGSQDAASP
jgi:membrane peptidoglycan carboxypeptidase